MRIAEPFWLYLLIALPFIAAAGWWGINAAASATARFVSPELVAKLITIDLLRPRRIGIIMLTIVLGFSVVAMARIQYGVKPVEVRRAGIDILIAVDTSQSMAAEDVKPSRIARAKFEIGKIITALEGNRIGLIAFAGRPFIECPLTLDSSTLKMFLDTVRPGIIPVPGTDIGRAIDEGIRAFGETTSRSKVILLITDGESFEGDTIDAAKRARAKGVIIFPIGIGSVTGAPVPTSDGVGYKKDDTGSTIMSRLDVAGLNGIASATGGRLYTSQGEGLDLTDLVETLERMEKTDIASHEYTEYEERFQIFIGIALALLLIDGLLVTYPLSFRKIK